MSTEKLLCEVLYFDKAKNLKGYTLNTVVNRISKSYYYDKSETGYRRFKGKTGKIMGTLTSSMNATFNVKISKNGFINKAGNPVGSVKDVLFNSVDISMSSYLVRDYWKMQFYPFDTDKVKIISNTHHVGYAVKLALIFNAKFWIAFIPTCFISVIVLMFISKHSMSLAALEFVRIFSSGATTIQPQSSIKRVVFLGFVAVLFYISTFVQSRLSAINIVPDRNPTIESVEDLLKFNVTIYGYLSYQEILRSYGFNIHFNGIYELSECIDHLLNGNHAACLISNTYLEYYMLNSSLIHISRENIIERGITFNCREDFPLQYKFNEILSKLKQAGLIKLFMESETNYYIKSYIANKISIGLDNETLNVGFMILYGGWVVAVLTIFIELIFYAIKNKLNK